MCVCVNPRFESTNDVLTASPFNAHFPMSTMLDACVRQKYKMIDNTTCTSVEMYITGRRVQFRCCYRLIACKMIDSPHVPSILILLISSLAAWLALVFILSVFIWDLQCKSHFNRKMVFRVTKSQSMKDKLSFI